MSHSSLEVDRGDGGLGVAGAMCLEGFGGRSQVVIRSSGAVI